MRTSLITTLLLALALLLGCSGDDNPASDDDNQPTTDPIVFEFASTTLSGSAGSYTSLALQVENLPEEAFAVSFRINRTDADVVTYVLDETAIGPCFGEEAILFYEMDDDIFCGAVSRVAGDDTWVTEGTVAVLRLNLVATGSCTLTFDEDEFVVYDDNGDVLDSADVDLGQVKITVVESD